MFVRDLFFSCLRRWYFLLAGLIITGVGTYFAFGMVSPHYEAKASVVLIPPAVAVTVGDNPYLYLGGLEQALGVLQVKASSPEVSGPLLEKFPDASIGFSKDGTTSGPIMAISVTGATPGETMSLLRASLDLIPSTLAELQKELNVPAPSIINSMPLSMDVKPTVNSKKQIQFTAIVALGGIAVTLLLTGFIDRLMSAPRRRNRKRETEGETKPFEPRLLVDRVSDSELEQDTKAVPKMRRSRQQKKGPVDSEASADVGT